MTFFCYRKQMNKASRASGVVLLRTAPRRFSNRTEAARPWQNGLA
jgi:hypothetical protein